MPSSVTLPDPGGHVDRGWAGGHGDIPQATSLEGTEAWGDVPVSPGARAGISPMHMAATGWPLAWL